MIKFLRLFADDRLYAADAGPGHLYLIVPGGSTAESIGLAEAWSSTSLLGIFAYARGDTGVTAPSAGDFVDAVKARLDMTGAERGFMWLADPAAWEQGTLENENAPLLGMNAAGKQVQAALKASVAAGVRLTVADQSLLTFEGEAVTIGGAVSFDGTHAPTAQPPVSTAVLGLGDADLGTLAFSVFLTRSSLCDKACWGFQFVHPASDGGPVPQSEWLPLAAAAPGDDALGFSAVIDPSDPVNQQARLAGAASRSRLAFTGTNADGARTELTSQFRTRQGTGVALYPVLGQGEPHPAELVFNPGAADSETGRAMQLAPEGDFEVGADVPDVADLLCGLNGTEMLSVRPRRTDRKGDRLRFRAYQPGYAPRYPFPEASPVSAPVDASLPLLDASYTTSWASAVAAYETPIGYTAQPRGAALYGQRNPLWSEQTGLMGWQAPASPLPPNACFPLVPYAGLATVAALPQDAADFERQIVGPTRRRKITPSATSASPAYTAVTAAGMLVTVTDGRWTRVLLGQTIDPPVGTAAPVQLGLYFCNPAPPLQEAFESGDLFLVAANEAPLGHEVRGSGDCTGGESLFGNTVRISGWELSARVGTRNHYGDYRNVLILKGRKGKLYDRADVAGSLVANPERWTQPALFAAPSDLAANPEPPPGQALQPPDPAETVVLSQWLKDYFDAAVAAGTPALARFNEVAVDPDWTGVLVLRMDIAAVPDDLAGIMAGIADPDGFAAHHLGIELTPTSAKQGSIPGPSVTGASSMFGLIDYVDPAFTPPGPGEPVQPVPPAAPGTVYDFRVLSLQATFANTAIRSFRSYAQLTATSWFDTPVGHMGEGGNPYRAIVLQGTLQTSNDQPVYSMSSTTGATFYFAHDVLAKLEITDVAMSTRNTGREPGQAADDTPLTTSWFSLAGYLDFKKLRVGAPQDPGGEYDFDVFSFGSQPTDAADDGGQPRTGLAFSNLGITLTFPPQNPADARLALDAGAMRFEVATSTPRPGSLFRQFALEVEGIVSGLAQGPPSKLGYAPVVTSARLNGVDGSRWWGIGYRLPLGTPGNLAGRVGLTAHLLTAWSAVSPPSASGTVAPPGGPPAYSAALGLELPGSDGSGGLISLQNVLKLSAGQIWLQYDNTRQEFFLMLSEIALKLFGLLSIPPGTTICYLFGNMSASGQSPSGLGWYAMYRKVAG